MAEFEFLEPNDIDEEHLMLRAQLRRFVNEYIMPRAEAWEKTGQIERSFLASWASLAFSA